VSLFDQAKKLADQHDDKVDQALDRVGDEVDKRTGHRYSDKIDRGVDMAQERTGGSDRSRPV
jgi:hypothetical protein